MRRVRLTKERLYAEARKIGGTPGIKKVVIYMLKSMKKQKGEAEKSRNLHSFNPTSSGEEGPKFTTAR
jgi:hypothetical protein